MDHNQDTLGLRRQLLLYARDLNRTLESERERTRQLEDANRRLAILNRLKSDFLTFISHQLRTPLNHLSAVYLLDHEGDESAMTEVVQAGYERFANLIETGLKYFEWLAQEPGSAAGETNARVLVEYFRACGDRCRSHPFRLSVQSDVDRARVRGRQEDLERVARILLDNAVKFSAPEKPVAVALERAKDQVVVTVRDEGCGFPPQMAFDIFQPFTVTDVTHYGDGTGMSLALAATIIDAYGGRLSATSDGSNTGATFRMELPVAG